MIFYNVIVEYGNSSFLMSSEKVSHRAAFQPWRETPALNINDTPSVVRGPHARLTSLCGGAPGHLSSVWCPILQIGP